MYCHTALFGTTGCLCALRFVSVRSSLIVREKETHISLWLRFQSASIRFVHFLYSLPFSQSFVLFFEAIVGHFPNKMHFISNILSKCYNNNDTFVRCHTHQYTVQYCTKKIIAPCMHDTFQCRSIHVASLNRQSRPFFQYSFSRQHQLYLYLSTCNSR